MKQKTNKIHFQTKPLKKYVCKACNPLKTLLKHHNLPVGRYTSEFWLSSLAAKRRNRARLNKVNAMRQSSLREELALKAVKTVHASLTLRSRASELEPKLAGVELLPQLVNGLCADVLHPVLDPLYQIRQVAVHRSLVLH
mmetsp:Transcript_112190/g.356510  ORF Transcript_112190/g.356510 Transcript_112190/m.356510 type:complete len:140 (-) Transcript_112190:1541-1960(-)